MVKRNSTFDFRITAQNNAIFAQFGDVDNQGVMIVSFL